MSVDDNKAIIRVFVETVWNGRQLDRAGELVAADFVDHAPMPGQAPGLEGVKRKWAMYLDAIPDFRITIEDLVAEGEKVAVRRTYEGTHRGGRCWAYRPLASGSTLAASVFFGWLTGGSPSIGSSLIGWP
jgi:predicted ester cyclase